VLFDCFPDGTAVLGGAAFNVAWHLHALGCPPLFISRVGTDARGDEILARMQAWGLCTDGLQRDAHFPTGTVSVSLTHGQPSFAINADQAYDHIDGACAAQLAHEQCAVLYHGSLALRTPRARAAFDTVRRAAAAPVFVDVNLRAPWWDAGTLAYVLQHARWFKCNHDELRAISAALQLSAHDEPSAAAALLKRFHLAALIVTRGAEGAAWYPADGTAIVRHAPLVENLIDAVGAGDAFSAVVIDGLLRNVPPAHILERAVAFAACICEIRGAVPTDRAWYRGWVPG